MSLGRGRPSVNVSGAWGWPASGLGGWVGFFDMVLAGASRREDGGRRRRRRGRMRRRRRRRGNRATVKRTIFVLEYGVVKLEGAYIQGLRGLRCS